jgi:hypothetical protein
MTTNGKNDVLICEKRDGRIVYNRIPVLPPPAPPTLRQRIENGFWAAVFFIILIAVAIATIIKGFTK